MNIFYLVSQIPTTTTFAFLFSIKPNNKTNKWELILLNKVKYGDDNDDNSDDNSDDVVE